MGYNHMLGRPIELDLPRFQAVVADFKRLLGPLEDHDAYIGYGYGDATPRIDDAEIQFGAALPCRHGKRKKLRLVTDVGGKLLADPERQPPARDPSFDEEISGFEERRACNGDCAHEDFSVERIFWYPGIDMSDREALHWRWYKTNRKPYDLAVMCCILVVRHHFGRTVAVDSHGDEPQWLEARLLCERVLGYGLTTPLWQKSA